MGFDVLSKPRYLCVTCFYCLAVYKTQTGNASLSLCLTYLCTGRQVDGGESEGPPSGMPPCQPWANLQGLLPAQPQCLKPSVLGVCRPYRFLIFWIREMSVAAFSLATKICFNRNNVIREKFQPVSKWISSIQGGVSLSYIHGCAVSLVSYVPQISYSLMLVAHFIYFIYYSLMLVSVSGKFFLPFYKIHLGRQVKNNFFF